MTHFRRDALLITFMLIIGMSIAASFVCISLKRIEDAIASIPPCTMTAPNVIIAPPFVAGSAYPAPIEEGR